MVYSTCLFETYGKEYTPRLIRLISSPGDDVKGQAVGEIHCEKYPQGSTSVSDWCPIGDRRDLPGCAGDLDGDTPFRRLNKPLILNSTQRL